MRVFRFFKARRSQFSNPFSSSCFAWGLRPRAAWAARIKSFFSAFAAAALAAAFALSAGCTPSDQPKIVPAQPGPLTYKGSIPDALVLSAPPAPSPVFSANISLNGLSFVCAQNTPASVVTNTYGVNGRLERVVGRGLPVVGIRLDKPATLSEASVVKFTFDASNETQVFQSIASDGNAVEVFFDASKKPVLTCFQKLGEFFIWTDSQLVAQSSALSGTWNCAGPWGRISISDNGVLTSASGGAAQAFFWQSRGDTRLTVFDSSTSQSATTTGFDRFFDARLQIDALAQGKFSYEALESGPAQGPHLCAKAIS